MMFRAVSFSLLSAFIAQFAFAEPGVYKVVGVASDDTLNVRAEPNASSADIGDLAYNAQGVEISGTDTSGNWGSIIWEEGNAWVSMRFLAPDTHPVVAGTRLPTGLTCSGTEPFWTMKLSDSSAIYSSASGLNLALSLQGSRIAMGQSDYPLQLGFGSADAVATLLTRPQSCSDGMSDRVYPWSVDLLLNTSGGGAYLLGCCQLPLDAGSH